jgi:transcriptional regulator with XRE-family HTH domain
MNLAVQLRVYRKSKGHSVKTVSQITGIPADRIYKWEKGTKPQDAEDLLKIREYMDGKLESKPEKELETPPPTPETTDTPLPSGNASRTLADYIAMIEQYNTTMSAAITAGLINLKEGQQQLKEQIVSSSAALAKLIEAHTVAAPGLSPQGGKRLKQAKEDGKGKDH